MKVFLKSTIVAGCLFLAACGDDKKPAETVTTPQAAKPEIPVLEYSLVSTFAHDKMSFTEGLLVHNGQLFESTGSPEGSEFRSMLGPLDLKTGKIDVKAELDNKQYFGEGIVVFKNKIYQVTYRNQKGFMYDAKTFKKSGEFSYAGEGWGMTTDGENIIMSNGTDKLTWYDADFKAVKTLAVTNNGYAQESLNELEFINGFIYANLWMTGEIVKIDPSNGHVVARINLTPLSYEVRNLNPYAMEMNGIAFDAANDKIYVTGKCWPSVYEVSFKH